MKPSLLGFSAIPNPHTFAVVFVEAAYSSDRPVKSPLAFSGSNILLLQQLKISIIASV
eukprot:CAMPEP_0177722388 /NCGR_PEP_ID=MMETSP0484_2-20121128/17654_1 /TAXON_ID=354590 /ORGANISM="Rhodomonas lens, Strain RHODO" /LENGTH=57 /DNA_ID=CAMNT_0019234757 /DNA_START=246 /DNA_END=416 /DNA_ORIENTATION=-